MLFQCEANDGSYLFSMIVNAPNKLGAFNGWEKYLKKHYPDRLLMGIKVESILISKAFDEEGNEVDI